jgi:hypothetical protein
MNNDQDDEVFKQDGEKNDDTTNPNDENAENKQGIEVASEKVNDEKEDIDDRQKRFPINLKMGLEQRKTPSNNIKKIKVPNQQDNKTEEAEDRDFLDGVSDGIELQRNENFFKDAFEIRRHLHDFAMFNEIGFNDLPKQTYHKKEFVLSVVLFSKIINHEERNVQVTIVVTRGRDLESIILRYKDKDYESDSFHDLVNTLKKVYDIK